MEQPSDPIHFTCKSFYELSLDELYAIMALRQDVFVVEQNCPYLDADGIDPLGYHLMGWDEQQDLVAYSRLLDTGISYDNYASIGRVLTSQKVRGKGLGKLLMQQSIHSARQLFFGKGQSIKISAQCYLIHFYESFGFRTVGKDYLEDDIPHIAMVLENGHSKENE